MILLSHILIALGSVLFTTYSYISPSLTKLRISYVFIASTLASGTVLVIASHSNMLRACITGLAYTTMVTAGVVAIRVKLAKSNI